MVFTLDEIRTYLKSQPSIGDAIKNLSEQAIVDLIEDFDSLNFQKDEDTLIKYEAKIGLHRLKEEQITIYSNSHGKKGKYWMALSPKWADAQHKSKLKTEFEIAYWVNYGDDETYGWFSVEEIKKWLTNPDLKLSTIVSQRKSKAK